MEGLRDLLESALVSVGSVRDLIIADEEDLPMEVSGMLDSTADDLRKAIAILDEQGKRS